jgi:copper homeostasis protein
MKNGITVEICCGSYEDVLAAEAAGADRVELNSSLFLGGLTPSLGSLLLAKKNTSIKVIAMVRPRAAGFLYSGPEYEVMKEDARLFLENGADGIVFGFLHADGTIDEERTKEFVKLAGDKDAVFHRAFDVTPEPFEALEALIKCGVKRILTSGQEPTVPEGVDLIKELVERAAGRIEILPGAGITRKNVSRIVAHTKVSQIHFAALESRPEPSVANNRSIYYGGALFPPEDMIEVTSAAKVAEVIGRL